MGYFIENFSLSENEFIYKNLKLQGFYYDKILFQFFKFFISKKNDLANEINQLLEENLHISQYYMENRLNMYVSL